MTEEGQQQAEQSKEEQIGFHKGAISTLVKERQELQRILQIVEQLMQMHVQGLKDLGVDLESQAQQASQQQSEQNQENQEPNKKIDDLI